MANTMGIAASPADEVFASPQLFAGDTPPVATRDILIPSALNALPQYTPLSFASGAYKLWAATETVVAVTAYAVPDSGSAQRAACYVAGCFNIDAIAWPDPTTEAQAEVAQVSSALKFRKLLYSNARTSTSVATVGPGNQAPTVG